MHKFNRHKKTPALAGAEVWGNEINFEEEIVVTNNSTALSNVIPFRKANLLLIGKDDQPFVAMKPVVEGMGLAWQTQHRKLMSGRFAAVITIMVATGVDGKQYEMACLPLRKLAGWLMSIHASKVREELRADVIAYQNECDDVLWEHWNRAQAASSRVIDQGRSLIGQTIGIDGFHMLGSLIKGKVSVLSLASRRSAGAKIWAQTHAAFGVRCAEDIPAEQLDAARNFVAAYAIEGEFLPKPADARFDVDKSGRYLLSFNHNGEQQITKVPDDAYVLSQTDFLKGIAHTPGDIPISMDGLFEFAIAAMNNLRLRAQSHGRRA